MRHIVKTENILIGNGSPLVLISGPCVIENYETTFKIASFLKDLTNKLDVPFIFKASYDKANRTSINAFRGPGIDDGLKILETIKSELGVTIISDVHRMDEIDAAARVLDIIQIPAFLCRQTDLIVEIAKTGKPLNIKKGQFLAPWDIINIIEKVTATGNNQIVVTNQTALDKCVIQAYHQCVLAPEENSGKSQHDYRGKNKHQHAGPEEFTRQKLKLVNRLCKHGQCSAIFNLIKEQLSGCGYRQNRTEDEKGPEAKIYDELEFASTEVKLLEKGGTGYECY